MLDIINCDIARQVLPYFISGNIVLPGATGTDAKFFFTCPQGYVYLLRSMRYKLGRYRDKKQPLDLTIEFRQPIRGRTLQNIPFPPRLISTPGELSEGYEQSNGAGIVKNNLILNFIYYRQDTIDIRFSYKTLPETSQLRLFLMLEGYFLPDKELEQWQ